MVIVFALPLVVAAVDRNGRESLDCDEAECDFLGYERAVAVVAGEETHDDFIEFGWREAILFRLGDPFDMLTCSPDTASVSVMTWWYNGDEFETDVFVIGWSDGDADCGERRRVLVDFNSVSRLDGARVRYYTSGAGDTFVVERDG